MKLLTGIIIGATITTLTAMYWRTILLWAFTRTDSQWTP